MIGGRIIRGIYRRRPVLCSVTVIHAGMLLTLVLSSFIQSRHRPQYEIIEVQILDLPADSTAPSAPPVTETPDPPDPSPPTPPPETPSPEPAQQEPAPPPEPSWRPRSPEDIRQDSLRPSREPPPPTPRPLQPDSTPSAEDIASQVHNRLRQQNLTVSIPESSQQPAASQAAVNRYLGAIITLLERAWQQPSSSTVPAGQRRTTMSIEISGDGSIRQARLSRSSGNPVMDQSVQAIFQQVRQLPSPRTYDIEADPFQINVVFELE